MKSIIFSLLLLTFSAQVFADSLKLSIELAGLDTYELDGNRLKGLETQVQGNFSLKGKLSGESIELNQAIPATKAFNDTEITLKGKSLVRVENDKEGVDVLVKAKVNKNFFGNFKSMVIKSEENMKIVQTILEKQGQAALSNLNISADSASIEMKINVSDYKCKKDSKELVICESTAEVIISVKDNN